jgi:hypothetical protein
VKRPSGSGASERCRKLLHHSFGCCSVGGSSCSVGGSSRSVARRVGRSSGGVGDAG